MDDMHPDGVSALMYAAAGGYPDVVKLLLNGEGPGKADANLKHVQVCVRVTIFFVVCFLFVCLPTVFSVRAVVCGGQRLLFEGKNVLI